VALGLALLIAACGPAATDATTDTTDAGTPSPGADLFDEPLDGLTTEEESAFFHGDALFDLPLRDADGLGPLYVRSSCSACHDKGVRGPGSVQKMSVVLDDGVTTSPDQSKLPYGHSVRPLLTGDAKTPVVPPAGDPSVEVSLRVGPPILGRGYLEAILDSEIERVAAEQAKRSDAIHGRINHVVYTSEPNPDTTFGQLAKGDTVIGRFGVKARIPTLDDFTADALQGDMGLTTPLRPDELPNPDGLLDDAKPGVDLTADSVNVRATYIRLTAIPWRPEPDARARALFDDVHCSACHVPTLKTRADYPIAVLAGIDAPVFTDMLLHDMGDDLADGMTEGEATSRDFRTAPLLGLRFDTVFLHDGRARSIDEAIRMHDGSGSEAAESVALYRALSADDRDALLDFVGAL
jgi:CxxC motif-containing protein (DUF1111 family)